MYVREINGDVIIVGGGLGGVAATLALAERDHRVVLTEVTDWLGGQATSAAVPLDEHPWIEQFGCTVSYRRLRNAIRQYYRDWYPLRLRSLRETHLNPGAGRVGALCAEPRVIVAVIEALLAPHLSSGRVRVLLEHAPRAALTDGDNVSAVVVEDLKDGESLVLTAPYVVDATETGELLPLAGVEHVTGSESRADTSEPHASDAARPLNMQAFNVCFAMDYCEGEDHTIERPSDFEKWRAYVPPNWPGPQLGWKYPHNRTLEPRQAEFLPNSEEDPSDVVVDMRQTSGTGASERFGHRRVLARRHFEPHFFPSDITIVNWPMTDYLVGPLFGEYGDQSGTSHLANARQLSLSFLYWLQTEAPRPDDGHGYPGLRLRPDVVRTKDGLAKYPYIRESRRIIAEYTIVENDLSADIGGSGPRSFDDSVGVGAYRIDLHPTCGGDNFLDIPSRPFEIPLGCLMPVRVRNLLPGGKNVGTTHITNGALRLHDSEWTIGEVVGSLVSYCIGTGVSPSGVRNSETRLADFQNMLSRRGVELSWPSVQAY